MKRSIYFIIAICAGFIACKKPYTPEAVMAPSNYLVVEGVIVTGGDSTIITLSRTVSLDSKAGTKAETGAKVAIQSSTNEIYGLTAGPNGTYYNPGLILDNSKKYRLAITTKDNKQYASDYVQAQVTPPIDSITYKPINDNLQLYVNSHDDAAATRYYRFDYKETWEFHSLYKSVLYSDGKNLLFRTALQNIYNCFGNHASSVIVLGSTATLTRDVLSQAPVTTVSSTDEKLQSRYSILVRQYALSKEAYTFWETLRKNTEQLGGIFDAQPTNIQGNIHGVTTPTEQVFGYISASTVTNKRIFIDSSQLPSKWTTGYPYKCGVDTILPQFATVFNVSKTIVPIGPQYADGTAIIIGYFASTPECVDCTVRGTNKKPSFW